MPRVDTWRSEVSSILNALESLESIDFLCRQDIENLFRLKKRAALRLLAKLQTRRCKGEMRVSRARLIDWLNKIKVDVDAENQRAKTLLSKLRQQKIEDDFLRRRFRDMFGSQPLDSHLLERVKSATVERLPPSIQLSSGKITVLSPDGNPSRMVEYLFELALAIQNDWDQFSRAVATSPDTFGNLAVDPIDEFLNQLEVQRHKD